MWKKADSDVSQGTRSSAPPRPGRASTPGGATIGSSIVIDGDVTGSEDMTIHGRVKGTVKLPEHRLQIGPDGHVEATAFARSIIVDGRVRGDLSAEQEIVVRGTGDVQGNLAAPRIGLEEGAKFKGRIDMEPVAGTQHQPTGRGTEADKSTGETPGDKKSPADKQEEKKPDGTADTKNKATG